MQKNTERLEMAGTSTVQGDKRREETHYSDKRAQDTSGKSFKRITEERGEKYRVRTERKQNTKISNKIREKEKGGNLKGGRRHSKG